MGYFIYSVPSLRPKTELIPHYLPSNFDRFKACLRSRTKRQSRSFPEVLSHVSKQLCHQHGDHVRVVFNN